MFAMMPLYRSGEGGHISVFQFLSLSWKRNIGSVSKTSEHQTAANWLFYQVIVCPISQIWVLFSLKIIKSANWVRKQFDCWLPREVDNWYQLLSRTSKRLKNSLNWQETGIFKEKRGTTGRRMKSSPMIGHPPNSLLTRGRGFQSNPIRWVLNRGVCNTDCWLIQISVLLWAYCQSDAVHHALSKLWLVAASPWQQCPIVGGLFILCCVWFTLSSRQISPALSFCF